MKTKTRQHRMTNVPTPWAAELTHCPATATPGASSDASDLIPIATIAGGSCRPAETAGGDTVATLASNGQHVADAPSVSLSTSVNRPAIRLVLVDVSRPCEHCGAAFVARRPWARFCSAYCRRAAWLDRNPERAAELAERDKARLRSHIVGNDGEWVD